jgi:hypothetical protein
MAAQCPLLPRKRPNRCAAQVTLQTRSGHSTEDEGPLKPLSTLALNVVHEKGRIVVDPAFLI